MSKRNSKLVIPPLPDDGMHDYMAVSAHGWGTAPTAAAASKICRDEVDEEPGLMMVVPKGATMNELGNQILWRSENGHGAGFCPRCVIAKGGQRKEACG